MDRRKQDLEHGLDNCESAFFDDMPLIVTSSPISEGKRGENTSPVTFRRPPCEDNTTWSDLLGKFQSTSTRHHKSHNKKEQVTLNDESTTIASDLTSSSYQPIAEHRMKILLTPGRKVQVLSSTARKIHLRQPTPKKPTSYSKLSQQYRRKLEDEQDKPDESLQTIRTRLKSADNLSPEDIERYEKILRKAINQNEIKKEADSKADLVENSDLMRLFESEVGRCNLSPTTVRMLGKHSQDQEKRLIGLTVLKRKSAAEIKKKINQQLVETKEQIRNREQLELKLVKAAHRRRNATANSTLFNQLHSAHHKRVVTETRQKDYVSQLQRKMQSEKNKSGTHINKVVQDVWKTFLQEQYNELRNDVREQQLQKVAILKESEEELKRLKINYEDKLKELKDMAAAKAAEAGMEKKEISREIERIQRNMQHQFRTEFQTLMRNIETKGDHKRFTREENASRLKERLQKADYVFDL